jgi:hypothetical protein
MLLAFAGIPDGSIRFFISSTISHHREKGEKGWVLAAFWKIMPMFESHPNGANAVLSAEPFHLRRFCCHYGGCSNGCFAVFSLRERIDGILLGISSFVSCFVE